ncbi:hypothetical protein [Paenibacillus arenosi]|uniref:Uncharacterized protein n=1 Tax=Paenibacillus arenosi TaxID=2774142 RepID=A0ABR9AVN8_9BACL|nr:hypothetical protein [Paenibacillus arenosi]MBD8497270.1 hypothetical protein [Paenibacillus arenosi]
MHISITKHWNLETHELPGINCVIYPNGNITILNCSSIYNPNTKEDNFYCTPLCDTTLESIEKYNADFWTIVDEWVSIDYQEGKILGGDGQMGNEGFIACTDGENNLVWGIFFENSNPIRSLQIKENILIAINEHTELQIEINLENLTQINMTAITPHSEK